MNRRSLLTRVLAFCAVPCVAKAAALPAAQKEERVDPIKVDYIDDSGLAYGWQTVRVENPDDPEEYVMVRSRIVVLQSGQVLPAPYGSPF